jgi:hypothetical protein
MAQTMGKKTPMTADMITPNRLRQIAEEKEMAQLREALEKQRKADEERDCLNDAFIAQDIHPEVFERVSRCMLRRSEVGFGVAGNELIREWNAVEQSDAQLSFTE